MPKVRILNSKSAMAIAKSRMTKPAPMIKGAVAIKTTIRAITSNTIAIAANASESEFDEDDELQSHESVRCDLLLLL